MNRYRVTALLATWGAIVLCGLLGYVSAGPVGAVIGSLACGFTLILDDLWELSLGLWELERGQDRGFRLSRCEVRELPKKAGCKCKRKEEE